MILARSFESAKNGAASFRSDSPMSDAQIAAVAPSAFAEGKHSSRSDRYAYFSTADVLRALRQNDFHVFQVAQGGSRDDEKRGFTKHLLRLRHRSVQSDGRRAFEVILINSHDGTSSYQMLSGMLEFVCLNGLVSGREIEEVRVRHAASKVDEVVEGCFAAIERAPVVLAAAEAMRQTQLTIQQAQAFARGAAQLRYGADAPLPINPDQLLHARHFEQRDTNLWNVFNRVQENMIRGGISSRSANGRMQSTRAINGIDQNIAINRALWTFAQGAGEIMRGERAVETA